MRTRPNLIMVDGITPYAPYPEWYRDKANPGEWFCYWCAMCNYAKMQREQERLNPRRRTKQQQKKRKTRKKTKKLIAKSKQQ